MGVYSTLISFVKSVTVTPVKSKTVDQDRVESPNVTDISTGENKEVVDENHNLSKSYLYSLRLSPEQPVKRKARKNYQFVKKFESLSDLDAYVRMSTKSGYKTDKNNGPVNCWNL